jgi:hypothetical protein
VPTPGDKDAEEQLNTPEDTIVLNHLDQIRLANGIGNVLEVQYEFGGQASRRRQVALSQTDKKPPFANAM